MFLWPVHIESLLDHHLELQGDAILALSWGKEAFSDWKRLRVEAQVGQSPGRSRCWEKTIRRIEHTQVCRGGEHQKQGSVCSALSTVGV